MSLTDKINEQCLEKNTPVNYSPIVILFQTILIWNEFINNSAIFPDYLTIFDYFYFPLLKIN
jgi:hypothetical protein